MSKTLRVICAGAAAKSRPYRDPRKSAGVRGLAPEPTHTITERISKTNFWNCY